MTNNTQNNNNNAMTNNTQNNNNNAMTNNTQNNNNNAMTNNTQNNNNNAMTNNNDNQNQTGTVNIINCTPHPVSILNTKTGQMVTIPKGDIIPRVASVTKHIRTVETNFGTINITQNTFGQVENLPEPQPNTFLIVSAMVMNACPNRTDLVCPNESVRDAEGRIIGCQSLALP
jgi:hypothetical protein